jgi:hypothetical protein
VEEVTDEDDVANEPEEEEEKTVVEKVEEVVEEVVEEIPKKVKKLKQKMMPTILPSENEAENSPKKKSKSRHISDDENDDDEDELSSRKTKKSKAKEPEPTPTKKSKSRKSAEVENVEENIVPEHISAFDLKDDEKNENERILVEEDPPTEPPKKDTKPKKPKKKVSKNEQTASKSNEEQEEDSEDKVKTDFDAGSLKLKEKLYCKYRKSCYESRIAPEIKNDPLAWHTGYFSSSSSSTSKTPNKEIPDEKWNQMNEQQRKLECKYRQSCYETRKLPPILSSTDVKQVFKDPTKTIDPDITPEEWQKRSERKRKVLCKYRKSCYDSGKLPKIERSTFFSATHTPTETKKEVSQNWAHKNENERKVECKYRKSCYESGKLPSLAPATVETVIESIHDNPKETLQQRCKYRKSCYAATEALKKASHEQKSKPGVIDEETLIVKNAKTSQIKEKSAEKKEEAADTSSEEKRSKKADSKPAKKQKQKPSSKKQKEEDDDDDSKEEEYKEIPQEDKKPKVNATELAKNITTNLKLACKYRQSCYVSAIADHLPPEQIMRMRGVKCSKYRISCREQLGLPPLIRAPIGPNGRKLCRKKKPEESLKM